MIALTDDEVREFIQKNSWFTNLVVSADGNDISYSTEDSNCIDLKFPETPLRVTYFVRVATRMLLEAEDYFNGGMLWFKYWHGGSPQLVKTGWKLVEKLRLAYGETRPLAIAPGHAFESDEFTDMNAFLLPCFVFGWDAYLIPSGGEHFVFISHDDYWTVVAKDEKTYQLLMTDLKDLEPKPGNPGSLARFCGKIV
jgi:hypothetical protein